MAYQCRKCRHINYDRLDAFLCVECGYCASGNFALEIDAAIASNAVAIVSDKEHARAMKILGAVNTLYDGVKAALAEAIKEMDRERKETSAIHSKDVTFDLNMQLALMGVPPIVESSKTGKSTEVSFMDRMEKPGSLVKLAARPESLQETGRPSDSPSDRTQSLLRLARQIRAESGGAWDRRRSGDLLLRHLGRGVAVDTTEGQRNLIALLEDSNVLDSADSLGRAVASARVSARMGRVDAMNNTGRPLDEIAADGNYPERHSYLAKTISINETIDECQRLHGLLREAQQERYELKRRIQAWEMLNEGYLVDTGHPIADDDEISLSHCSVCGPSIAFNLLSLWVHLFVTRPGEVHIDADFVNLLLTDLALVGKTLSDQMRKSVTEIASKSEDGARLVLSQIRRRLLATNDPVSAEILGKIMAVEGHFLSHEYATLAMELLSHGQG